MYFFTVAVRGRDQCPESMDKLVSKMRVKFSVKYCSVIQSLRLSANISLDYIIKEFLLSSNGM